MMMIMIMSIEIINNHDTVAAKLFTLPQALHQEDDEDDDDCDDDDDDDDDSDDDGDDDDKKSRFDCVQCPSKLLVPTPFTSYVCIRLYIHPSPINNPSVI